MSNRPWATDGFVQGLKIRMMSNELKEHLIARADYHATRKDEKEAQLPAIEAAVAAIKLQTPATVQQFNKGGTSNSYRFDGDDTLEQLKGDILTHNNKALAFRFIAEHLFEETYCLDGTDLVRLEILKQVI